MEVEWCKEGGDVDRGGSVKRRVGRGGGEDRGVGWE